MIHGLLDVLEVQMSAVFNILVQLFLADFANLLRLVETDFERRKTILHIVHRFVVFGHLFNLYFVCVHWGVQLRSRLAFGLH